MKMIIIYFILSILFGCNQNMENNKFNSYDPEFIRPKITQKGSVIYPDSIKVKGHTGVVMVECTIDTMGNIIKKNILKTSNKKLDEAALATMNQYKFDPAIYGQKKIISKLVIPVRFE